MYQLDQTTPAFRHAIGRRLLQLTYVVGGITFGLYLGALYVVAQIDASIQPLFDARVAGVQPATVLRVGPPLSSDRLVTSVDLQPAWSVLEVR